LPRIKPLFKQHKAQQHVKQRVDKVAQARFHHMMVHNRPKINQPVCRNQQ
jgi:hypothetical protein